MPHLADLLVGLAPAPSGNQIITAITSDSRRVTPGALFAALPGTKTDGAGFIAAAVAAGAVAVIAIPGTATPPGVVLVGSDDPRRLLARLAARFHAPAPACAVAVTGTNGKSSVAGFTRALWQAIGFKAASIGTLGIVTPDAPVADSLTTPDPVTLHATLADLATRGIDHVAIEASSHGLDQRRLDGLTLRAAAFTNLSRDHLDYHGTMSAYLAAKARLFETLLPADAASVLNADAAEAGHLGAVALIRRHRAIRYGTADAADLRLVDRRPLPEGQALTLDLFGRRVTTHLPLVGGFQAMNVLAALGLVIGSGSAVDAAVGALAALTPVPGRLERVATSPNGGAIYVDYAHTPDALETVLTAIRPHVSGRLVCVFGAGGDRDRGKRPLMGEAVGRLADYGIVTDDNPRTEDPAAIRAAVRAGSAASLVEIGDRAQAIRHAIAGLSSGDILVIAGKGHEQGQTIGIETRPFDDAAVARAVVALPSACASPSACAA